MMNTSPSALTFNPFGKLSVTLQDEPPASPPSRQPIPRPLDTSPPLPGDFAGECRQFLDAMDAVGVKPFALRGRRYGKSRQPPAPSFPDEISEVLAQLEQLVGTGEGFHVSRTPEYIEGTGACVPISYAWRLHRGDFSIQSHIDLHGLNLKEARAAFDAFLKEAVSTGKRAVLVIHGRGLSSPAEPVLKNGVRSWLTSRAWQKWVLAFASAQPFDGGAGATYILLRESPLAGKLPKASSR